MHPDLLEQVSKISQKDEFTLPLTYFLDDSESLEESYDNTTLVEPKNTPYKILSDVKALELFKEPKYFNDVWCYHSTKKQRITLKSLITNSDNVCLAKGVLRETDKLNSVSHSVVVKIYQGNRYDTRYEVSIYKKIREELNIPNIWFSSSFYFWNVNVLVMERLYAVNGEDDEYEVLRQTIPQLTELHRIGVHNDLKIQNIMKRGVKNGNLRKIEYLIIDFGGFTMERLKNGYRRMVWTPKVASQQKESGQITYPRNDLIELCHAMRQIQLDRIKSKTTPKDGFEGKLKDIYKFCLSLDDYPRKADYEKIINMTLSK
jgi:serine/threonine protein kinase